MLLQSTHPQNARGLDAYFTPPEATLALLRIENLPHILWEPAVGNGAISDILKATGRAVFASDIADYQNPGVHSGLDFLQQPALPSPHIEGIVTNPPFRLAQSFAEHALSLTHYVVLLGRTNFLEGGARLKFWREFPPSRVWVSSRRFPMMHREGPRASNTRYAWFVWDYREGTPQETRLGWFDWQELLERDVCGDGSFLFD